MRRCVDSLRCVDHHILTAQDARNSQTYQLEGLHWLFQPRVKSITYGLGIVLRCSCLGGFPPRLDAPAPIPAAGGFRGWTLARHVCYTLR
jgi:hypothetical protein